MRLGVIVTVAIGGFFALLPQSRGFRRALLILPILWASLAFRMQFLDRPVRPPDTWTTVPAEAGRYPAVRVAVALGDEVTAGLFLARVEHFVWEGSHWRRVQGKRERLSFGTGIQGGAFHTGVFVPKTATFRSGCRLDARVWGRSLPRTLSDSGFDTFLRKKGITSIMSISGRSLMTQVCPEPSIKERVLNTVDRALEDDAFLSGRSLSAARALLLGRMNVMDKEFRRFGKELGIVHIFAASGFHMAVFFACLHAPLALLLGRRHPAALFVPLPLCTAYIWFLSFPVSLCRSYVFVCVYALQSVLQRRIQKADILLNSGIVILLWMPDDALSLSSLLSFGATAGIMYYYDTVRGLFPRPSNLVSRILFSDLSAGFSASVAALPMLLYVFHSQSFSAPAVNLVLLPLTGFALPILYLYAGVILAAGPGTLSWVLGNVARICMDLFVAVTELSSHASFYHTYPSFFSLPLVLSCAAGFCLIFLHRKKGGRWLRAAAVSLFLLLTPLGSVFSLAMARAAVSLSLPGVAGFFGTSETWNPILSTAPLESEKR